MGLLTQIQLYFPGGVQIFVISTFYFRLNLLMMIVILIENYDQKLKCNSELLVSKAFSP